MDDRDESRFAVEQDGSVAELVYEIEGDRLVLVHTGVPRSLCGRRIGGMLVRAAVDRAAEEALTIAPRCPFARKWLQDHPAAAAAVAIDWESEQPQ